MDILLEIREILLEIREIGNFCWKQSKLNMSTERKKT